MEQTHTLVLASGTLAPLGLLQRQLFPHLPLPTLHAFTCGHVVPASRLLLLPFSSGPSGLDLDLRHATRSQTTMMDELGRLLLNICQAVPQVMSHCGFAITSYICGSCDRVIVITRERLPDGRCILQKRGMLVLPLYSYAESPIEATKSMMQVASCALVQRLIPG